jgi:hypothetical protein
MVMLAKIRRMHFRDANRFVQAPSVFELLQHTNDMLGS